MLPSLLVTRSSLLVIIRPWLQPRSCNICIEDYWNKIFFCKGSSWNMKWEKNSSWILSVSTQDRWHITVFINSRTHDYHFHHWSWFDSFYINDSLFMISTLDLIKKDRQWWVYFFDLRTHLFLKIDKCWHIRQLLVVTTKNYLI